jgi:hypothetical protein
MADCHDFWTVETMLMLIDPLPGIYPWATSAEERETGPEASHASRPKTIFLQAAGRRLACMIRVAYILHAR